jgi:hypothetical protein
MRYDVSGGRAIVVFDKKELRDADDLPIDSPELWSRVKQSRRIVEMSDTVVVYSGASLTFLKAKAARHGEFPVEGMSLTFLLIALNRVDPLPMPDNFAEVLHKERMDTLRNLSHDIEKESGRD